MNKIKLEIIEGNSNETVNMFKNFIHFINLIILYYSNSDRTQ